MATFALRIRLQNDTNCVHRAGCPSWGNIVRLFLIFLHLSRSFGRKSRRGRDQFSYRAKGENRQETILIDFCLSYISILMQYRCSRWINIVQSNIAFHKLLLLTTVITHTETSNNNVNNIFCRHQTPFDLTNLDLFVVLLRQQTNFNSFRKNTIKTWIRCLYNKYPDLTLDEPWFINNINRRKPILIRAKADGSIIETTVQHTAFFIQPYVLNESGAIYEEANFISRMRVFSTAWYFHIQKSFCALDEYSYQLHHRLRI